MRRWLQALTVGLIIGAVVVSYGPLRERKAFGSDAESWQTIAATVQSQGVQGLNTQGRTEVWGFLAQQYHEHPIAGNGVGTSEAVLASSPTFGGLSQAHSDYMAVLVNGGLIALGLWLVSFGGLAVRFARLGGVAAPAAAAVVLYLLVAITDNAIEMYAYLGIPLAALVAIALNADSRRVPDRGEIPSGGQ
jgi:O-antigen ligase